MCTDPVLGALGSKLFKTAVKTHLSFTLSANNHFYQPARSQIGVHLIIALRYHEEKVRTSRNRVVAVSC